ncbi:MAG: hypothetical protein Fur002_26200 [Anaerolineales bacterium]
MLMTAAFILPPPQVGQVSDLPNLIRAGGESSARFPNLSVPLAALALVAESKRKKGEGLNEAQRRHQGKVEKRWKEEAVPYRRRRYTSYPFTLVSYA